MAPSDKNGLLPQGANDTACHTEIEKKRRPSPGGAFFAACYIND